MNDTITVAATVTVDPETWADHYGLHHLNGTQLAADARSYVTTTLQNTPGPLTVVEVTAESGEVPFMAPTGKLDPREVVARIEQKIEDGYVVTCSECSEELPSDSRCEASEDGEHVPDQELDEPPDDDPTRWIELALRVKVPDDGYDYMTDVAGRLETLLSLLNLHPLVTASSTAGPSGSGFVREVDRW